MTVWKHATVRIDFTINFPDDGQSDLFADAITAALEFLKVSQHDLDYIEVVGGVQDERAIA